MAGGFSGHTGAPPAPRSGASCLTIGAIGCVAVIILGAIGLLIMGLAVSKSPMFKQVMKGQVAGQQCGQTLTDVRRALSKYRDDHHSNYPASLNELSPKYLAAGADSCAGSGASQAIAPEFTPPGPNSPDDAPVVSYEISVGDWMGPMQMRTYIRLLKNDMIVQDQVTRTETNPTARGKGWRADEARPSKDDTKPSNE